MYSVTSYLLHKVLQTLTHTYIYIHAYTGNVSVNMFVSTARGLPQNIMVTSTERASLRVQWEPPSDIPRESITGYMIKYTRIGSNDKGGIKVEETTHTISGLVACEGYSVQVATLKDDTTGSLKFNFSNAVEGVAGEDGELCIHTYKYIP